MFKGFVGVTRKTDGAYMGKMPAQVGMKWVSHDRCCTETFEINTINYPDYPGLNNWCQKRINYVPYIPLKEAQRFGFKAPKKELIK